MEEVAVSVVINSKHIEGSGGTVTLLTVATRCELREEGLIVSWSERRYSSGFMQAHPAIHPQG